MKTLVKKYFLLFLLTLFGAYGYSSLPVNTIDDQATPLAIKISDASEHKLSKEEFQEKKFELAECEIIEESLHYGKKTFDSEGCLGFGFSSIYTPYIILLNNKLPIGKFYSFCPVFESLYIIYKVFRL